MYVCMYLLEMCLVVQRLFFKRVFTDDIYFYLLVDKEHNKAAKYLPDYNLLSLQNP